MSLTKEDKLKILARVFYIDNEDTYEDYRDALTEFMAKPPPDQFIDFSLQPYLKPAEEGCILLMTDSGHVASIRIKDGYFEPRTETTENEDLEIQAKFTETADQNPGLDGVDLLYKMGWKKV